MTSLRRLLCLRPIISCIQQNAVFAQRVKFSSLRNHCSQFSVSRNNWSLSNSRFSTKVDTVPATDKSEINDVKGSNVENTNDNQINAPQQKLTDSCAKPEHENKQKVGVLEGKLKLGFTCKKCSTRNYKVISKIAYNKGVVIVQCSGCKNNHLIADNLGWFDLPNGVRNIEHILRHNGETIRRIWNDTDGYFEAISREEYKAIENQQNNTVTDNEKSENLGVQYEKVGNKGQ